MEEAFDIISDKLIKAEAEIAQLKMAFYAQVEEKQWLDIENRSLKTTLKLLRNGHLCRKQGFLFGAT